MNLTIFNSGDVNIKNISVSAFGQEQKIYLDTVLTPSKEISIDIIFSNIKIGISPNEIIYVNVNDNLETNIKEYLLPVHFVDITLSVVSEIISGKQNFKVTVENKSSLTSNMELICFVNGEKRLTQNIVLVGGEIYNLGVNFPSINEGDYIYFIVSTNESDVAYYDNEVGCFSAQTEIENVKKENKYHKIMQQAKGVMI